MAGKKGKGRKSTSHHGGTQFGTRTRTVAAKPIVIRERTAAPNIRVSVPRAAPVKRRAKGHRRHHASSGLKLGGGTTGAMSPAKSASLALGGFLYGFIEKNFGNQIPNVPVFGKSGTIAIGAYFLGGKSAGIIADVGNAAAVIAGYSFGSTGRVSGAGMAPQVSGIAAQV